MVQGPTDLERHPALTSMGCGALGPAIQKQSWNEFVILIPESYQELIRYLKERRLYVNEPVINEEEI